jgi:hypothetical protein
MSSWHRHRARIEALAAKSITPAVIVSLRREVGEVTARELIEIATVQPKAVKKFGPGLWMGTQRAVEQASESTVATYKASLMRDLDVIDLCGGIGGDAMAFAARGRVVTVDRDPRMTAMAGENLRTAGALCAAAVCADVELYAAHLSLAKKQFGIHIDPDRRVEERRTVAPSAYSPGLGFVMQLARASNACWVKLAPAAELPDEIVRAHHRQWISYGGSVREQSLLCGDLLVAGERRAGERSAVRVLRDGSSACFVGSVPDVCSSPGISSSVLAYLYDFDPAIRAAGLSEAFALSQSFSMLCDASGFFSSDHLVAASPLLQSFKTVWTGPADLKLIKKQLAIQACTIQSIKVRGTDHDPAKLLKQLKQSTAPDGGAATLLIGRCGKSVFAAIATAI